MAKLLYWKYYIKALTFVVHAHRYIKCTMSIYKCVILLFSQTNNIAHYYIPESHVTYEY